MTPNNRRCLIAIIAAAGAVALAGCKAQSGTEYHSDIDRNGQPFDGSTNKDSRSADVSRDDMHGHECESHR